MLTVPLERAKTTLAELADRVATRGEPVALELADGRKVLLTGFRMLPWLERFDHYQPPSRQAMRAGLKRAAALRAEISAAGRYVAGESVVETLNRIREERLRDVTGDR